MVQQHQFPLGRHWVSWVFHLVNVTKYTYLMKVEVFSQKQNLNFVERQAFACFKHGFFQVWGKCLPQSFPTPNGVTVLDCPAILLGHVCFVLSGRCYCHYLFTKILVDVIAIVFLPSLADVIAICFVVDVKPLVLFYRQMLLPYAMCDRCYCHS